jgi:hypothetical protein
MRGKSKSNDSCRAAEAHKKRRKQKGSPGNRKAAQEKERSRASKAKVRKWYMIHWKGGEREELSWSWRL